MHFSRFRNFLERLEENNLQSFLIVHPPNLRYLFGFTGSFGRAFISNGSALLLVDSRYLEQAENETSDCTPVLCSDPSGDDLRRILGSPRSKTRLGIEAQYMSYRFVERVESWATNWEITSTNILIEGMRAVKTPAEISLLEKGFNLAGAIIERFLRLDLDGKTERQIAAEIDFESATAGSEGPAFDTIVASGARTSLPHATADAVRIKRGEPLLIDFGIRFRGYCTDLTRSLGPARSEYRKVFEIVNEARSEALKAIRPGVPASSIDEAARQVIRSNGYEDYFGHSTGHGLGLEIHELPRISQKSDEILQPGMVFTIEPGIYLPNQYGVRLEDAVVVTEEGGRLLSGLA